MRRAWVAAVTAAAVTAAGGVASAQTSADTAPGARPGIRQLGAAVQQRLQLTDDQTARLRETSQRYAAQRRALQLDERDARQTVREEVARGDAADQARVQAGLDRLYQVQQRRSELASSEQRELATFLTPTQRAQYAGMQERAFRAAQAIRQQRAEGLGAAVPPSGAAQQAERRAERQQQQAMARQQRAAEQAARRAARAAARGKP